MKFIISLFVICLPLVAGEKPNLVLIIADDMNWDDCGVYGHPSIKTPNIDAPAKRMVFLSFGWGVTEESWYPDITKPGNAYKMPTGLAPLERHRQDFSIIQGLWHKYSLFNDAGHSGSTFWLTGANRFAQPGVSFANTISVDQVAA
ncbi:DUF1552 domain-containing protein, partial [bacterium]|nr:DUF1552 domain-containing protein [bacterium]